MWDGNESAHDQLGFTRKLSGLPVGEASILQHPQSVNGVRSSNIQPVVATKTVSTMFRLGCTH